MFFVSLKNELIISSPSKVDLLIFSETFIKLKLPQSNISSRNDTRSEVLFKRTLNVIVIFKISRVISCASERDCWELKLRSYSRILKNSSFRASYDRETVTLYSPATDFAFHLRFDHNHLSGVCARFPDSSRLFIAGYESSVSFSSVTESRCNDLNLERAPQPAIATLSELSFPPFRFYAVHKCRARAHTKFTIVYPREMKRMPGDYRRERKRKEKGNHRKRAV